MDYMAVLKIIIPVLVGGIIGYCTNFIAIKMLFRPYREYHIGKLKIPFTPGIIPKNKGRMAAAVGNAVSEQLLTAEDLTKNIISSDVKKEFTENITDTIFTSDMSISTLTGKDDIEKSELAVKISNGLALKIRSKLLLADMQPVIDGALEGILKDYRRNPMIGMFLTDKVILAIDLKIEDGIKNYVRENGKELFASYINEMIASLSNKPLKDAAEDIHLDRETVSKAVEKAIDHLTVRVGEEIPKRLDISKIVREKLEAMDVEELERLLMSVMKNELQAVINLGAVLGAIIGAINIFI